MATTRMKIRNSASVYHRVGASGDMSAHDVGTTDSVAQGMGGAADFELESDTTVAHVDVSKIVTATGGGVAIGSTTTINDYLYIKNTGYTTAAKTTTTAALLKWGIGDPDVNGWSLSPGESIILHGAGSGPDNLDAVYLESSSGDIYTEIKYL
jgi:hypothetical protein